MSNTPIATTAPEPYKLAWANSELWPAVQALLSSYECAQPISYPFKPSLGLLSLLVVVTELVLPF